MAWIKITPDQRPAFGEKVLIPRWSGDPNFYYVETAHLTQVRTTEDENGVHTAYEFRADDFDIDCNYYMPLPDPPTDETPA